MGGGGFTMEPDNPALDDFVLGLAAGRDPRICLLPTAGGDSESQIHRYYATFSDRACEPTHVSLFRLGANPVPLREHLLAQDVIYVGGGSMVNLLAIWHAQGLPTILREAWQRGIVLAGLSAGSMCWFEYGITTSVGRRPRTASGSCRARTRSTTTASPSGGRRSWKRCAAARSPAVGAPTTAPRSSSTTPSSPRSSLPARPLMRTR